MKKVLLAINHILAAVEKWTMLGALALMLLAVLAAIAARPLAIDVPWATPLVLALMIVATFAGAALATQTRRHITMDLLTKALSPRARAAVGAFTGLLGGAICAFLCAAGVIWVRANMGFDDPISLALKIPDWYLQAVVPVGFGLCAVHFLINMALDGAAFFTGDFSHLPDPELASAHGLSAPGAASGVAASVAPTGGK